MPSPSEEIVYEVDDDDQVLREVARSVVHDQGLRHRSVAVLCRDPAGRVLVHRRTATKRMYPSYYDMYVAGAVEAGETYREAAARELGEEIGVSDADLRWSFAFRYDGLECPQWTHGFETVIERVGEIQGSEIAWWAWLSEAELVARLADTSEAAWPFTPDSREAFEHYLRLRSRT